jgi:asparagine synthase (glutamine-hydrolysing)
LNKLPAATAAEFAPGRGFVRQWRYWEQPEAAPEGQGPSFEESVERTEALFLEAVRLRLEADVPVGALLSGGVDSGLVCWAIQKLGGKVTAFTISTPGDAGDETADARATAAELGIRHEVIEMRADREPSVGDLVAAYGEPFGCASALGMMQVSEAVKPQATVLLTGDGGDDVFLGYPEHKNLWLAQRMAGHLPAPLAHSWLAARQVLTEPVWKPLGPLRRAAHFLDYCAGGVGAVAAAHDGLPNYDGILSRDLMERSVDQRKIRWTPESGRQVLSEFLRYDQQTRFPGEYMQKVDGGTMFHALEARSPFLDHELWDFAGRLPFGQRLQGGQLKAILRELAARRISPRVAHGAKRGFSVPVRSWLTGRWKELAADTFTRPRLAQAGWVDAQKLEAAWRRAEETQSAPVQLWYLFVLEHWLRAHHG